VGPENYPLSTTIMLSIQKFTRKEIEARTLLAACVALDTWSENIIHYPLIQFPRKGL
jgi:hypothetical protein